MLDASTVSSMTDDELGAALSKRNKRDPRCTGCKVPLVRDGRRQDGMASHNGIVKGLSLKDDWIKFVSGAGIRKEDEAHEQLLFLP